MTKLGIRHTTSSPHHPRSNGFIERQVQTIKRLLIKTINSRGSISDALANLRATPLGENLPSPAEILHGCNMITGRQTMIDVTKIREELLRRQVISSKNHDSWHRTVPQRQLVVGEKCYYWHHTKHWYKCTIISINDNGRSYQIITANGRLKERNRELLKPESHDLPFLSGPSHTPKVSANLLSGPSIRSNTHSSMLSGPSIRSNTHNSMLSGPSIERIYGINALDTNNHLLSRPSIDKNTHNAVLSGPSIDLTTNNSNSLISGPSIDDSQLRLFLTAPVTPSKSSSDSYEPKSILVKSRSKASSSISGSQQSVRFADQTTSEPSQSSDFLTTTPNDVPYIEALTQDSEMSPSKSPTPTISSHQASGDSYLTTSEPYRPSPPVTRSMSQTRRSQHLNRPALSSQGSSHPPPETDLERPKSKGPSRKLVHPRESQGIEADPSPRPTPDSSPTATSSASPSPTHSSRSSSATTSPELAEMDRNLRSLLGHSSGNCHQNSYRPPSMPDRQLTNTSRRIQTLQRAVRQQLGHPASPTHHHPSPTRRSARLQSPMPESRRSSRPRHHSRPQVRDFHSRSESTSEEEEERQERFQAARNRFESPDTRRELFKWQYSGHSASFQDHDTLPKCANCKYL